MKKLFLFLLACLMLVTISCTSPVQSDKTDSAEAAESYDCKNCIDVPFSFEFNGESVQIKADTITGDIIVNGKKMDPESFNIKGLTISLNDGKSTLKFDSLTATGKNGTSSFAIYGLKIEKY